jgi:hypothetical protein
MTPPQRSSPAPCTGNAWSPAAVAGVVTPRAAVSEPTRSSASLTPSPSYAWHGHQPSAPWQYARYRQRSGPSTPPDRSQRAGREKSRRRGSRRRGRPGKRPLGVILPDHRRFFPAESTSRQAPVSVSLPPREILPGTRVSRRVGAPRCCHLRPDFARRRDTDQFSSGRSSVAVHRWLIEPRSNVASHNGIAELCRIAEGFTAEAGCAGEDVAERPRIAGRLAFASCASAFIALTSACTCVTS